ncbi:MAG TPA: hypothetical protein VIV12_04610 [Streptosporangiaceae bacterium]
MPPPASSKRWCGCAATTWPPRPPPATSSGRCWGALARFKDPLVPAGVPDRAGGRHRLPDPQADAQAAATPVTRASGKTTTVRFRMATNRNAGQALHIFADNPRHGSPWAAKLDADARARGKRHPQAIRILGRAWLRVIWARQTPRPTTTRCLTT